MKTKILSILFLALLLCSSAFAGDKFEDKGITYEIYETTTDNGVVTGGKVRVIAGVEKYAGDIVIPEKVTCNDVNYIVCEVGERAFYDCKGLTSISVPNSVTSIEQWAFYDCKGLTSISVPNSVTSIEQWAFSGCSSLTSVELSDALVTIGAHSFSNCTKLENITLPNSLKEINNGAFSNSGLKEIFVPKTVSAIIDNPFSGCKQLETIIVDTENVKYSSPNSCNAIISDNVLIAGCKNTKIPDNIVSIGEWAFYDCKGLTSISVPNSVTSIEQWAFSGCSSLTSVELPDALVAIGAHSFSNCTKLENITLPNSLKEINNGAFSNSGLKEIFVPKTVSAIISNPFSGCQQLETIIVDTENVKYSSPNNCNAIITDNALIAGCKNTKIPNGIVFIGEWAFYDCKGLTSISVPNSVTSIEQWAFSGCSSLTSVELSDALVTIGAHSFSNCTKLESILLPNSLKEIKNNAFTNCRPKTIVSEIESPFSIDKNVFNHYSANPYSEATLYVKKGLVSVYKETDGWKEFENIQEIPSNVSYTANNNGTSFTYSLNPLYKTGAITEFNSVNDDITIPEKVAYNGQEYVIESIDDGVFAHKDIVTVTFPQKIQSLGTGMFTGSHKLSAIIWKRTDRPSDELVRSIENPNVLFYANYEDAVPNILTNVIVNNVAKNIKLIDAPETNFYCPQEFTAENISYTHTYSLKTEKGVVKGWESIALPFNVQKYETSEGEAKPYAVATSGEKLFWLRELTNTGFKEAAGIKANIPYIISMPNWDGYQPFYNIEGDVTFSATDAVVPKTEVKDIVYGNKTFWPSYSTIKAQNEIYVLNRETIDDNAPGSIFVKDNRKTNPFECYFTYSGTANARAINICDMMDGATDIAPICVKPNVHVRNGIIFIDSTIADVLNIYNLSGKCIKSVKLNKGHNIINGLSNGTYIIGNQKIQL